MGGLEGISLRAGQYAFEKGLAAIVDAPETAGPRAFANGLDRRQEQVLEEPGLAAVEGVHGVERPRGVVADHA